MLRQFCDKCRADVTDKKSGHVQGIEHADNERGDGVVTHRADLCPACYQQFIVWIGAKDAGAVRVDDRTGRLVKRKRVS